jgi:hypothetical protein
VNVKNTFFRDVTPITNVMEEAAASIFYPKNGSKSSSETVDTDKPRVRHLIPGDITL